MGYERYPLKQELVIEKLITFYYFELNKDFYDKGEQHDFWELVYVDKGEFEIFTDHNQYALVQGECVFYKPNEYHSGRSHHNIAPHLIILSFECTSPYMAFFEGKSFRFQEQEKKLLTLLVQAGMQAFHPAIDSPLIGKTLQRREDAPFGCEQLIKNYLEILLITLLQRGKASIHIKHLPTSSKVNHDQEIVDNVIAFMQENLSSTLSLDDISNALSISKAHLKSLFRERTGLTTMRYFNKMKIDRAKHLIREGKGTFTEIAEELGFSSIHYFSKHFKKITDMNPTEYARTVRSLLLGRTDEA